MVFVHARRERALEIGGEMEIRNFGPKSRRVSGRGKFGHKEVFIFRD
jgi:hypothetical protein